MTPEEKRLAEKRVRNADQAQAVLDNPAFQRAVEQIDREVIEEWKATSPNAREDLEELKRLYHSFHTFITLFKSAIIEGDFDAQKLRDSLTH